MIKRKEFIRIAKEQKIVKWTRSGEFERIFMIDDMMFAINASDIINAIGDYRNYRCVECTDIDSIPENINNKLMTLKIDN